MPCCQWVLSLAESSSGNSTPSWLHRLHAKGGLSFPSHLQIDDLLYGRPQPPTPPPPPPPTLFLPPPPPPASSDRRLAVISPQDPPPRPKPIPKPPRNPARPNPSDNNNHPLQIQPPPPPPPPPAPLSGVISDLFAVPSAPRSGRPPKPFRKQSRPRPRPKDKSAAGKDDKAKAKARKRRRADRGAGDADGERRSRTDVTVIDTSTDGWKRAKLLIRKGPAWKIRDRKYSEISETEELNKGKRRAGLVAKVLRDKEREKDAASPGNFHASSGDLMKVPGDDIQTVKRPRSSEPVPAQSAAILLLPSSSTVSQP